MRIFKSRSSYELVVVLTDAEAVLYHEALRAQKPVSIPELDDREFMIKEICPHDEEGDPSKISFPTSLPKPDSSNLAKP